MPASPADRNTIQNEQQQLLERNQQQRDSLQNSITPRSIAPVPPATPDGPCFNIRQIAIEGATLLSPSDRQKLVAPWLNRCLNLATINQATAAVSDWYISRGYITSRAFLPEQNLSSGILRMTVLEGKIENIQLEGESSRAIKMAFPTRTGDILNLRSIEQGMEQINRTRAQPVQIEIQPGSSPGWSVVNLTASPEFPLSLSLGYDNSGLKNTGTGQITAGITGNNLLGLADRWYISGGRSSAFSPHRDAQTFQTGVSVPWGWWLFSYDYSWSNYHSTIDNQGWRWDTRGATENHRLNIDRVLFRNGDIKTAADIGITHRITRNYLQDVMLESSSRKLTSLQLGLSHTQKVAGGIATFNPTYSHGMPWLGAENDHHKHGDVPKAEFSKWSLSGSFQRYLSENAWWLSSFYLQWSPDRLYGSERLTLGGESSVRGYKEQYLFGDNGGYLRNELNYSLFTLPFVGEVSAFVALDGGWLKHDNDDALAAGTVWGAAAGLGTSHRRYSTRFTMGTPVSYPSELKPDTLSIYYRIALVL
ncbi:peptide transporter [Salmonella enterica subsp. enterica serovar Choleraesuis]|nr:peptide transporter [Salmonella enterica subsp. enterica serovar Choleraesuis]